MPICPVCNSENPEGVAACLSCGNPLERSRSAYTLVPGTKLNKGRYTVGKMLAQGGFGITYLGSEVKTQKTVAIKELFLSGCAREHTTVMPTGNVSDKDFNNIKSKFLAEGKLLAKFKHPGIVSIGSVFEENNTAYIAMEYLKGHTIKEMMESRGAIPESESIGLIIKVAEALREVHKAGILHRDIKPENIMLTEDDRIVLIDFGSARQFAAGKTKAMTSWLTPGYAPIEQYGRKARFSPATDLYALGATMYHMLTGVMPDQASDRVMSDELKTPNELNPEITMAASDTTMWAMTVDAKARPQSAEEFLKVLKGILPEIAEDKPVDDAEKLQPVEETGVINGWWDRKRVIALGLIVFSIILIGLVLIPGEFYRNPFSQKDRSSEAQVILPGVYSKQFTGIPVRMTGQKDGLEYEMIDAICNLDLSGKENLVNSISITQIILSIDVGKADHGSTTPVPVQVSLPDRLTYMNLEPESINVIVTQSKIEHVYENVPIDVRGNISTNRYQGLDPSTCDLTVLVPPELIEETDPESVIIYIDVSTLGRGYNREVPILTELPDGFEFVSCEPGIVTIDVVEPPPPENTKTFSNVTIRMTGGNHSIYEYSISPNKCEITIRGPKHKVDGVSSVRATVSLDGLHPGNNSVSISFNLPSGVRIKNQYPSQVIVTVREIN